MYESTNHYKSIDFDLDTARLRYYYTDYRTTYRDIQLFMYEHNFYHRQGSVYNSLNEMSYSDIIDLVNDFKNQFEWASACIKAFDVTDIGAQHSLLNYLQDTEFTQIQNQYIQQTIYEYI